MANVIEQDDFVKEVKDILNSARKKAYSSVNSAMVEAYWKIGKRIVEEEQLGEQRAAYGEKVIISLFKRLITDFPDSKFLDLILKNIFALENDKESLLNYYQTEPNLYYNGEIDKTLGFLKAYCNNKLGNFEEATFWFESIINNPESEYDSLMATIDLGYIQTLLQEKSCSSVASISRFSNISKINQQKMIKLLPVTHSPSNDSNNNGQNIEPLTEIFEIYPNPFNPVTSIRFSLEKENRTNVSIYNIRGQLVKVIIDKNIGKGIHSLDWNGTDSYNRKVSSGIYLVKVKSGLKEIKRKITLLK